MTFPTGTDVSLDAEMSSTGPMKIGDQTPLVEFSHAAACSHLGLQVVSGTPG